MTSISQKGRGSQKGKGKRFSQSVAIVTEFERRLRKGLPADVLNRASLMDSKKWINFKSRIRTMVKKLTVGECHWFTGQLKDFPELKKHIPKAYCYPSSRTSRKSTSRKSGSKKKASTRKKSSTGRKKTRKSSTQKRERVRKRIVMED